nr:MAG TPA: hypothetical protein [Caudoviricetes sp.]
MIFIKLAGSKRFQFYGAVRIIQESELLTERIRFFP